MEIYWTLCRASKKGAAAPAGAKPTTDPVTSGSTATVEPAAKEAKGAKKGKGKKK